MSYYNFPTEAALCDAFAEWARAGGNTRRKWTVYPETGGFDLLLVDDEGRQLGIEAKLRMNTKVCTQALPDAWGMECGPDWRGILVPSINAELAALMKLLGVLVFTPYQHHSGFNPSLYQDQVYDTWFDWNPQRRCELPPMVPSVPAGVPAPVRLTQWKVGALKVLAHLELHGSITAREVKEYGVDPRRFCSTDGWLTKLGEGRWARGCVPAFDEQHPTEYAELLRLARERKAA